MATQEKARLTFDGSAADNVRHFVYSDGLTPERAGYQLARQTLFLLLTDDVCTAEYLTRTLEAFADDDQKVHQPPLSDDLRDMCDSHLHDVTSYKYDWRFVAPRGQETAMLLNLIIDHGSRPFAVPGEQA